MGGGDYDAAVGAQKLGHNPDRWGRGDADIYYFTTSREKPGVDDPLYVF